MADPISTPDPLRARRDQEKEKRREAILDAAERVIAKHGWEATDFGKIATRARLSRGLVYVYFPTRDDLFHAVCARGLVDLKDRFAAATKKHKTGLEQAMALGRAYYAFAQTQPLYFDLISQFQGRDLDPENETESEKESHDYGRDCLGQLVQALANGVADGSIRKTIGDPRPSAVAIWAFTHGLIQISTRKECMLQQAFQLGAGQTIEHGFMLLRSSLAPP